MIHPADLKVRTTCPRSRRTQGPHYTSASRAAATPSAATATAAALSTAFATASGPRHLNARARLKPKLTFGDDGFAGLEALSDDHVVVHALRNRDRTLFDCGVGFDDKHERSVLP